jgi:hypothetical protein
VRLEGLDQLENAMTSSGIDPATFQLVGSNSINYATACPLIVVIGAGNWRAANPIIISPC